MRRIAFIFPLLLVLCGAVILWQSLTQMQYFNFDRGAPGPGFLPFWASLGVVCMGIAVVVQEMRRKSSHPMSEEEWPDRHGWIHIGVMVAAILVYLTSMHIIGFVVATILFMGSTMYLLGMRNPWVLGLVSVGSGIFVRLVFEEAMRMSLPQGITGGLEGVWSWIF